MIHQSQRHTTDAPLCSLLRRSGGGRERPKSESARVVCALLRLCVVGRAGAALTARPPEPSSLLPLSLDPGGDNNGAVLCLVPRLVAWLDRSTFASGPHHCVDSIRSV